MPPPARRLRVRRFLSGEGEGGAGIGGLFVLRNLAERAPEERANRASEDPLYLLEVADVNVRQLPARNAGRLRGPVGNAPGARSAQARTERWSRRS